MIVKMKFLSISGPRTDIDRVCDTYLSKHEMQLENAIAELRTTENLLPFVEVNPYKEPLAKAEQFASLLSDGDCHVDYTQSKEEILTFIRDLNHDYLELLEKKEILQKKRDEINAKIDLLEPFSSFELNLHEVLHYKYMQVRFGRITIDYFRKLEKYLYEDLQAIFMETARNENYIYGCYFASNADISKADSVFNSMHFERIHIPDEYAGTP